jgi:hypothetical protein
MLERVISGGQTGADQGGLRAARACGIPTGGWAPRGWLTEIAYTKWSIRSGRQAKPSGIRSFRLYSDEATNYGADQAEEDHPQGVTHLIIME